ncbi:hypothetical protein G6F63_011985 [Rhizopus arrhizus]|nr:hypothetical protein G6F18_012160 [Rhizopus arrhizus]KAG0928940.1 hypothetical protein G6F30_012198 [Rhizopus arrhizus]KAG1003415.1 hypothetical protein G6F27_011070 [Rhizopus arrhizus]KAG1061497.1 hypothetical protein G6F41_012176 [Rhizopus arrhizus]KAG1325848.1 hypothetical protein G6F63_011985 [Rhizopus arrhizus]
MYSEPPKAHSLFMSSSSSSFSTSALRYQKDSTTVEYAQRIWDQDETVYDNLNNVVEWIGNGEASSHAILKCYMAHFDFKGIKLEQAFRKLCSKLHLKGETQQIDRILYEFADRYFRCNSQCIFGTTDVVYSIVYSLLLLNTDLHVAQGDYRKMTRAEFIKNTMNAIRTQIGAPAYAEEDHLDHDRCHTSGISLQHTPSDQSRTSSSSLSYAPSVDSMPHNTSSWNLGSKSWDMEIRNLLKQMYTSIRQQQITNPSSTIVIKSSDSNNLINRNRVSVALKRSVGTIMWKSNSNSSARCEEDINPPRPASPTSTIHCPSVVSTKSSTTSIVQYQSIASQLHYTELPTTYTSSAPYYKEGMVVRKHLLEKTNQKAKHRDWKECFMVVDRSQLRMYKLESSSQVESQRRRNPAHRLRNLTSRSSSLSDSASCISDCSGHSSSMNASEAVVGGGDWLSRAQIIGCIDLKHALANALPSGYSRQRQHAFALQQSNGAVYLFQVGSDEQVHEWVSTCNYWAARESKGPFASGVSSMEYGWGPCLDSKMNETVTIHEWQAPSPPMMSSLLDESAQYHALSKHVRELSIELDLHRDLKPKMELYFSGSNNNNNNNSSSSSSSNNNNNSSSSSISNSKFGNRAMANWESKSHYLLHEIIKYQNYCDSIEKSLALQDKVMSS